MCDTRRPRLSRSAVIGYLCVRAVHRRFRGRIVPNTETRILQSFMGNQDDPRRPPDGLLINRRGDILATFRINGAGISFGDPSGRFIATARTKGLRPELVSPGSEFITKKMDDEERSFVRGAFRR